MRSKKSQKTLVLKPGGQCCVLAERFIFEEARRRGPGFSLAQEHDIMSIMMFL
jgi:hypothetical protein